MCGLWQESSLYSFFLEPHEFFFPVSDLVRLHHHEGVHTFSRTLKLAGPEKHHAGAKALWCAFMPDARQHPHGQGGRT